MGRIAIVRWVLSSFLVLAPPATASAQMIDVDLELVLAVDVSRSMDYEERRLQRDGYVAAFRHPEVIAAIASGPLGRIAVTFFEWAGPLKQTVVVPWTTIASANDANAFADRLGAEAVRRERGTSISGGLVFASVLFEQSNVRSYRRAVDVSGDGPNNLGPPVVAARDRLVADGVTINGLPIMLRPGGGMGAFGIAELDIYYEDCVVGGPGAFVVTVDDVSQFPAAIRRKLVLEIAGIEPEAELIPAAVFVPTPRIDCLIGEKRRQRWILDQE